MNDNPSAATNRTAKSSLIELVKLAGLPEAAADSVEIVGSDPVFPTRFRPVVPGAVSMAAAGLAAAALWRLKTGRTQRVRVDAKAAAAALRSRAISGSTARNRRRIRSGSPASTSCATGAG